VPARKPQFFTTYFLNFHLVPHKFFLLWEEKVFHFPDTEALISMIMGDRNSPIVKVRPKEI